MFGWKNLTDFENVSRNFLFNYRIFRELIKWDYVELIWKSFSRYLNIMSVNIPCRHDLQLKQLPKPLGMLPFAKQLSDSCKLMMWGKDYKMLPCHRCFQKPWLINIWCINILRKALCLHYLQLGVCFKVHHGKGAVIWLHLRGICWWIDLN